MYSHTLLTVAVILTQLFSFDSGKMFQPRTDMRKKTPAIKSKTEIQGSITR